tara:strand:- start:214 stop:1212 length:999 start_codon:yes stop_codon:yes gene_type:complete
MAIKILVEYPSLYITATTQKLASLYLSSDPSALLQYVDLNTSADYVKLNTSLFLDSETKNLYFSSQYDSPQVQVISMSESSAFDFVKSLDDSFSFNDSQLSKDLGKFVSESVSFLEDVDISVIYFRNFDESLSFTDNETLAFSLNKQDSTTIIEDSFINTLLSKADTATLSEASTISTSIAKSDSVSMSESFNRVVSFIRSFSDSVTLDDLASAEDPLQTDNILNKGNFATVTDELAYSISFPRSDSISFSDAPAYAFATSRADSVSLAESLSFGFNSIASDSTSLSDVEVISFAKSLSDSISVTESIIIELITGANGLVLNEARLNTNVLN